MKDATWSRTVLATISGLIFILPLFIAVELVFQPHHKSLTYCTQYAMAREGRDLGLLNVHQPQSPTADLVFIHGLDGHRRATWTNKSEIFWLPWLENHLRDVRIWTYGYDAGSILGSLDDFDLHVNQFLQDLSRCRSVRIPF